MRGEVKTRLGDTVNVNVVPNYNQSEASHIVNLSGPTWYDLSANTARDLAALLMAAADSCERQSAAKPVSH